MAFLKTTTEKCPKHNSYVDVQCPICMSILIEPVTLPCKHELCMPCFKETINKVNLCCPFCRKRVSSWVRKATRQNCLINENRWSQIKGSHPELVKQRMQGLDTLSVGLKVPDRILSAPGEIRQEYEQEKRMVADEKSNENNINEQRFWNYMKLQMGEKIGLPNIISTDYASTSKEINRQIIPEEITIIKQPDKDYSTSSADASRQILFFPESEISRTDSQLSNTSSRSRSGSSASNDSISQELCHFKPIKVAPKTPPKPQPDGRLVEPPLVLTTPRNLRNFSLTPSVLETCVPLRQKLSVISAERGRKRRKKDAGAIKEELIRDKSSVPCASQISPESPKNISSENEFISNSKSKSILPLEPNIPIADQTSSYASYSATASFYGEENERKEKVEEPTTTKADSSSQIEKTPKNYSDVPQDRKECDNTVCQIVEQQMALMNTLKQEESDWKFAQKLQRRYDLEWKRCRGVREPYQLRKRHITAVPVVNGGQRRKHV